MHFNELFELFKEFAALLFVDFSRGYECRGDSVPVVIHKAQIALDRYLTMTKPLDTSNILVDLRIKLGLSALVDSLENYRVLLA